MALAVIGAGLPRTGTLSMKVALEQIGFGPCYHMAEVMMAPWRHALWAKFFRGEAVDWEEVFAGYKATVDAPGCVAWRELMARYPEAKVILTIRDVERWADSMLSTVLSAQHQEAIQQMPVAPMFEVMAPKLMAMNGVAPPPDAPPGPPPREAIIAMFHNHRAAVEREVPAEKLLVFDVRQGWEPLCRFLGVKAPETPFPRMNESEGFHERFSQIQA